MAGKQKASQPVQPEPEAQSEPDPTPEQQQQEPEQQQTDAEVNAEDVVVPNVDPEAVSGTGEPMTGSGFEQLEASPEPDESDDE